MHLSFAHFVSMSALTVMVSACFPGPGFLQQKQESIKSGVAERENSVVTMTMNPNATTAQDIVAAAGSAIESTKVTFPPGAINIAMQVSLEEASSIATAATAGHLDLDNRFLNAGTAIGVTSNVNVDAAKPFSIVLPIPGTQLRLGDDPFATLSVLFKVKIAATGEIKTGIIPRHELVIADGFIKIETMYFGVYQAVTTEKSITAKIEAAVADTLQMKRDEKKLPPLEVLGRHPVIVKKDETVTLSGKNFRPTMTLAWNGNPIHKLKYISDSLVSFAAPSASALGLSTLNVTQEGTASTVSLVFQGDGSVRVGSFTPDEVCSGVTYFDLNGKEQQGSKTCSAPATCSSDGTSGCIVDGSNYVAAAKANVLAGNIKNGVTIAGVAGNVTPSPGACASDGASSCVVDGAAYKAAATATAVAGNIKKGVVIAGVTGDYPSATYPLAGANGGIDDLNTATFNAKIKASADFEWFDSVGNPYTHAGEPNIAAGLILNGVSIFGTVGSYVPGSISVSSLTATKGASKVALSWTRSGGSGVIVVRRAGASVSFTPTHGVNYAQGYTSGSDEVVYRGSAAAVDDTGVVDGTTYYYKAFAYNGDNAYSAASNEASVLYTDGEVCGGAGDNCYDDTAAITAGTAMTPLGKNLVYVDNGNGFMVWKDAGSSKILRANGLDEWAMKLNLDGKGFQGAGNEFTDYTSLAGRKCPPSVYIDDGNKVSANNCLYYTVGYAAQALNAAGTTQDTASTIGLNNWSNYNGGGAKWYVGNIKTCSDKGMRLPAVFETATTTTTNSYYPSDATPTFAGATNGIPSHASGYTWTASASTGDNSGYWLWSGSTTSSYAYTVSYYVRCVLP